MSSSKQKKVHYERGTKPSSHRHHASRDSGVGSSSGASLGTAVHEEPFSATQIEEQRYNLRVVQEALDAAYERIRHLEASNASLSESLAESHKENRTLKKEKSGLIKENEDLLVANDFLNTRLKRESSPRSMAAATSAKPERRSSFRKPDSPRQLHFEEPLPRPHSNHSDRRSSFHERVNLPSAPAPPPNPHPNPFAPRTVPVVAYPLSYSTPAVSYTPSTVSYTTSPIYAVSSTSGKRKSHDDGKYHLHPL